MKEVLFIVGTIAVAFVSQTIFGRFVVKRKLSEQLHAVIGFINTCFVMYILISEYANKIATFASSSPGEDPFWGYAAVMLISIMLGGIIMSLLILWSSYPTQGNKQDCAKKYRRRKAESR